MDERGEQAVPKGRPISPSSPIPSNSPVTSRYHGSSLASPYSRSPRFYRLSETTGYHGETTRYHDTVGESLGFEIALLALDELEYHQSNGY